MNPIAKNLKKYKKDYIWLILLILLSLFLISIRLFKGITYEYSIAINLIIIFIFPIYSLGKERVYKGIFFLIIPILIQLFFIGKICDPYRGISFYFLIPTTTFILVVSLLKILNLNSRKIIFLLLRYYSIIFLIIFLQLYYIYYEPQIFIFSHIFGYFHGSIYDRSITIPDPLIWVTVSKLALILFLTIWIKKREHNSFFRDKKVENFLLLSLFTIFFTIWIFQVELGIVSKRSYIEKSLGGYLETKHFKIYYSDKKHIEKNIEVLAYQHEFNYKQIIEQWDLKEPQNKIKSFIFSDGKEKKKYMGASNTLIAKPWLNEIYINYSPPPHPHIKHELSHILSASIGSGPMKIAVNRFQIPIMGLVEGFAVASQDHFSPLSLQEKLAVLLKIGRFPNVEKMLRFDQFWSQDGYRAYQIMGALFQFIEKKYGKESCKKLYKTASFKKSTGDSLKKIVINWKTHLQKIDIPKHYIERTKVKFEQRSIFTKVCPHTISNIKKGAFKYFYLDKFEKGEKRYLEILNMEPKNPNHLYNLIIQSIKNKKYKKANNYLKQIEKLKLSTYMRWKIEIKKGDILWGLNRYQEAKSKYNQILTFPIDSNMYREVWIKTNSVLSVNIRDFIYNYLILNKTPDNYLANFSKVKLLDIEENIVNYLYAKYHLNQKKYKNSVYFLTNLNKFDNYFMEMEIKKMQILNSFYLENYESCIGNSLEFIKRVKTEGEKIYGNSFFNFCNYLKTQGKITFLKKK